MKDKLIDFIENHRRDAILLGIVLLIVLIVIPIGIVSKAKQKKEAERIKAEYEASLEETDENGETVADTPTEIVQDVVDDEPKESEYKNSLGLDSDKDSDGRVNIDELEEDENLEQYEETGLTEPKYTADTNIFDFQKVMETNMDGSKISEYIKKVSYASFNHNFGSNLTDMDFIGNKQYYVGVEDELNNVDMNIYKGVSFESVGWLNNNLVNLQNNDAIKFTNLHVIENLATDKVALLCSYSWYSAFGLQDTLVFFEDCSGTLKPSDFKPGDIFSTTVFAHNIQIANNINGQNVVNAQYYTFPEGMIVTRPTDLLSNSNIAWLGPINFYDENNTANFAIYWYYLEDGNIETHILYPNGVYNDTMTATQLVANEDGSFDLQINYDVDKSVRATLYKPN